jgi:hypothetical protein
LVPDENGKGYRGGRLRNALAHRIWGDSQHLVSLAERFDSELDGQLQVSCSLVFDRGKLEAAGAPRRLPDVVTSDGPTGDVRDAKHTTIGEKEESGERIGNAATQRASVEEKSRLGARRSAKPDLSAKSS